MRLFQVVLRQQLQGSGGLRFDRDGGSCVTSFMFCRGDICCSGVHSSSSLLTIARPLLRLPRRGFVACGMQCGPSTRATSLVRHGLSSPLITSRFLGRKKPGDAARYPTLTTSCCSTCMQDAVSTIFRSIPSCERLMRKFAALSSHVIVTRLFFPVCSC
jgi:hypothetical protein